jgi:hypothetical protein
MESTAERVAARLLQKRAATKKAAETARSTGHHAAAERWEIRQEVYEEALELMAAEYGERPGPRDATPDEIAHEPDGVLEHLAAGDLGATETTSRLARAELEYRRRS